MLGNTQEMLIVLRHVFVVIFIVERFVFSVSAQVVKLKSDLLVSFVLFSCFVQQKD